MNDMNLVIIDSFAENVHLCCRLMRMLFWMLDADGIMFLLFALCDVMVLEALARLLLCNYVEISLRSVFRDSAFHWKMLPV